MRGLNALGPEGLRSRYKGVRQSLREHGVTYNIYADGDAIWIIGTHRLLDAVDDNLDKMLENAGWEEHSIFGDFVVCPESQYKAGHKQSFCIQSYKDIRLGKWN